MNNLLNGTSPVEIVPARKQRPTLYTKDGRPVEYWTPPSPPTDPEERRRKETEFEAAQLACEAHERWQEEEAEKAELLASKIAAAMRAGASAVPALVTASVETSNEYAARYFAWRETVPGKDGSCRQDYAKYRRFAAPRIGDKPIVSVTRADVEEI